MDEMKLAVRELVEVIVKNGDKDTSVVLLGVLVESLVTRVVKVEKDLSRINAEMIMLWGTDD